MDTENTIKIAGTEAFINKRLSQYTKPLLVVVGILAVFVTRTVLAMRGDPPLLSDLFTLITLIGSLAVLIAGFRSLQRIDWVVALGLGAVVGVSMAFATLFTAYPVFGIPLDNIDQGWSGDSARPWLCWPGW